MGTASMRALAMRVLLAVITMAQTASALRCVHSGICSLGLVKPFVGDISDSKGLHAAATQRSFKKEVILHLTFPNRNLDTKLLVGNWNKLGIAHVLLMADTEETAHVVAQQLPDVGCVWDSGHVPNTIKDFYRAWHIRYRTLARLVRMGYNVFMSDTDIVLFDDPYRYLKSPPFSNFTIINQPELLIPSGSYGGYVKANGNLLYVQNARRDGVAAWLLAEVTDRYLRWVDDDFALLKSKGVSPDSGAIDQAGLNDALSSVATGFPHFIHTIREYWDTAQADQAGVNAGREVVKNWKLDVWPLPKFMHPAAGADETTMLWLSMLMPHTEGVWPEEFGGRWYPEKRGNLSTAFMTLLKEDCDGCPLWPDVEAMSSVAAARAVPQERFLLAPPWLMCGYNFMGSSGSWLPDTTGNVWQVVGHAHYMPQAHVTHKVVWRQWFGQYDWSIAEEHWGTPYVFQANMQQQEKTLKDDTPVLEDQPSAPRLLVMYSRLRLHKLRSMEEFLTILHAAMQVAALSGRTLVWPDMPCNTSWVGTIDPGTGLFQSFLEGFWYPYGTERDKMKCMFMPLVSNKCLVDRRGMLGSEYEHFVQAFGITYDMQPNKGNTVFFPASGELHSTLNTQDGPASVIVEVAEHDAQAHMDAMALTQVVFLAHPVKVAGYSLGNWTCLDAATIEAVKEATTQYDVNSTIKTLPGRVVDGRLTLKGGLAPPPDTLSNATTKVSSYRYAGHATPPRSGPTAWCKPGTVAKTNSTSLAQQASVSNSTLSELRAAVPTGNKSMAGADTSLIQAAAQKVATATQTLSQATTTLHQVALEAGKAGQMPEEQEADMNIVA